MDRLLFYTSRRLQARSQTALAASSWTCSSCKTHGARRSYASKPAATSEKPFYVTTPIFYVNAAPHIGHLHSMILADVLKRWHQLKGTKSLMLTGTDEHGMKVQRSAAQNDIPPEQWCDANSEKFKELAQAANISYDFFMRTTEADHKEAVRHFWRLLKHRGYIYESKHSGWYCVSDEAFYPEDMVERRIHPMTGKVFMASVESGHEVEMIEEKTYHFRITALRQQLLDFYEENPDWVVPQSRMNEIKHWVEHNLEDLSISRPSSRLSWGIRVPDDDSQTIYVWVDALINYLTKAGFPAWQPGREHLGGWPADVQVLGKDILRFHAIYWPALLMAVDIPPPARLLSHAHWTLGGRKMSKSTGNVVSPGLALSRWGVDVLRFFMVSRGRLADDCDYDNKYIVQDYQSELQAKVGNLLGRLTRSKVWSIREALQAVQLQQTPTQAQRSSASPDEDVDVDADFLRQKRIIAQMIAQATQAMEVDLDPRKALTAIIEGMAQTNKFMQDREPWTLAKTLLKAQSSQAHPYCESDARASISPDQGITSTSAVASSSSSPSLGLATPPSPTLPNTSSAQQRILYQTIYLVAESLRIAAILLQPFMPIKAEEMLDILGVARDNNSRNDDNNDTSDRRSMAYAKLGADYDYGIPMRPVGRSAHDALFPPLEVTG